VIVFVPLHLTVSLRRENHIVLLVMFVDSVDRLLHLATVYVCVIVELNLRKLLAVCYICPCLSGGKRRDYQNCSVLCSVLKLLAHLDEQFLQFSGLGFVALGHFCCA